MSNKHLDDVDDLHDVWSLTHDDYLTVLAAVRPRTRIIELVYANGPDDDEWELEHVFEALPLLKEKWVNEWPGTRTSMTCPMRRYATDRSVFAAFREQEGFFITKEGPWPYRGRTVERTGFGCVDVIFRDQHNRIIACTTTHEGILRVDDEILAAMGRQPSTD